MEMNGDAIKEVFDELFTLLEGLETSNLAVLQLMKDRGMVTEEQLAAFVEQAGNASSVKWRAARVRMEFLLTPVQKEKPVEKPDAEKEGSDNEQKAKTENGKAEANGNTELKKDAEVGVERKSAAS